MTSAATARTQVDLGGLTEIRLGIDLRQTRVSLEQRPHGGCEIAAGRQRAPIREQLARHRPTSGGLEVLPRRTRVTGRRVEEPVDREIRAVVERPEQAMGQLVPANGGQLVGVEQVEQASREENDRSARLVQERRVGRTALHLEELDRAGQTQRRTGSIGGFVQLRMAGGLEAIGVAQQGLRHFGIVRGG